MKKKISRSTVLYRSEWFKSSYSNAGGSCVETRLKGHAAQVRDSKDRRTNSPAIEFSAAAWTGFLQVLLNKNR
ncbi:DUF397 domain-containing protein [Amycolatopsis sp. NPDC048633]|uniref:DUF397 domain-containing protein n=1 Tax=Amycolatopsis sp. NPDC048633 TaxID=3157095 RepID=UPI0033D017B2